MPVAQVTENMEFCHNAWRVPPRECRSGGPMMVRGWQVMVH